MDYVLSFVFEFDEEVSSPPCIPSFRRFHAPISVVTAPATAGRACPVLMRAGQSPLTLTRGGRRTPTTLPTRSRTPIPRCRAETRLARAAHNLRQSAALTSNLVLPLPAAPELHPFAGGLNQPPAPPGPSMAGPLRPFRPFTARSRGGALPAGAAPAPSFPPPRAARSHGAPPPNRRAGHRGGSPT